MSKRPGRKTRLPALLLLGEVVRGLEGYLTFRDWLALKHCSRSLARRLGGPGVLSRILLRHAACQLHEGEGGWSACPLLGFPGIEVLDLVGCGVPALPSVPVLPDEYHRAPARLAAAAAPAAAGVQCSDAHAVPEPSPEPEVPSSSPSPSTRTTPKGASLPVRWATSFAAPRFWHAFSGLRGLRVDFCFGFGDADVACLVVACPGLERLSLVGCPFVTDESLPLLHALRLCYLALSIAYVRRSRLEALCHALSAHQDASRAGGSNDAPTVTVKLPRYPFCTIAFRRAFPRLHLLYHRSGQDFYQTVMTCCKEGATHIPDMDGVVINVAGQLDERDPHTIVEHSPHPFHLDALFKEGVDELGGVPVRNVQNSLSMLASLYILRDRKHFLYLIHMGADVDLSRPLFQNFHILPQHATWQRHAEWYIKQLLQAGASFTFPIHVDRRCLDANLLKGVAARGPGGLGPRREDVTTTLYRLALPHLYATRWKNDSNVDPAFYRSFYASGPVRQGRVVGEQEVVRFRPVEGLDPLAIAIMHLNFSLASALLAYHELAPAGLGQAFDCPHAFRLLLHAKVPPRQMPAFQELAGEIRQHPAPFGHGLGVAAEAGGSELLHTLARDRSGKGIQRAILDAFVVAPDVKGLPGRVLNRADATGDTPFALALAAGNVAMLTYLHGKLGHFDASLVPTALDVFRLLALGCLRLLSPLVLRPYTTAYFDFRAQPEKRTPALLQLFADLGYPEPLAFHPVVLCFGSLSDLRAFPYPWENPALYVTAERGDWSLLDLALAADKREVVGFLVEQGAFHLRMEHLLPFLERVLADVSGGRVGQLEVVGALLSALPRDMEGAQLPAWLVERVLQLHLQGHLPLERERGLLERLVHVAVDGGMLVEGQTLLYAALVHEHAVLTAALLRCLPVVNAPNPVDGKTPLHALCERYPLDEAATLQLASDLLRHPSAVRRTGFSIPPPQPAGPDPVPDTDRPDARGLTPLACCLARDAARGNRPSEMSAFLLEQHATLEAVHPETGDTVLHAYVRNVECPVLPELVRLLGMWKRCGHLPLSHRNAAGRTGLDVWWARYGPTEAAPTLPALRQLLLQQGEAFLLPDLLSPIPPQGNRATLAARFPMDRVFGGGGGDEAPTSLDVDALEYHLRVSRTGSQTAYLLAQRLCQLTGAAYLPRQRSVQHCLQDVVGAALQQDAWSAIQPDGTCLLALSLAADAVIASFPALSRRSHALMAQHGCNMALYTMAQTQALLRLLSCTAAARTGRAREVVELWVCAGGLPLPCVLEAVCTLPPGEVDEGIRTVVPWLTELEEVRPRRAPLLVPDPPPPPPFGPPEREEHEVERAGRLAEPAAWPDVDVDREVDSVAAEDAGPGKFDEVDGAFLPDGSMSQADSVSQPQPKDALKSVGPDVGMEKPARKRARPAEEDPIPVVEAEAAPLPPPMQLMEEVGVEAVPAPSSSSLPLSPPRHPSPLRPASTEADLALLESVLEEGHVVMGMLLLDAQVHRAPMLPSCPAEQDGGDAEGETTVAKPTLFFRWVRYLCGAGLADAITRDHAHILRELATLPGHDVLWQGQGALAESMRMDVQVALSSRAPAASTAGQDRTSDPLLATITVPASRLTLLLQELGAGFPCDAEQNTAWHHLARTHVLPPAPSASSSSSGPLPAPAPTGNATPAPGTTNPHHPFLPLLTTLRVWVCAGLDPNTVNWHGSTGLDSLVDRFVREDATLGGGHPLFPLKRPFDQFMRACKAEGIRCRRFAKLF